MATQPQAPSAADTLKGLGIAVPDGVTPEAHLESLRKALTPAGGPRGISISGSLAKSLSKALGTDIKEGTMALEDLQGMILANSLSGKQGKGGKIVGADFNKPSTLPSERGPALGSALDSHLARQSDTSLKDALTAKSSTIVPGQTPAAYADSTARAPGESLADFQTRQQSRLAEALATDPSVIAAKDSIRSEQAAIAAGKAEDARRAALPEGTVSAITDPKTGAVVGYTRKPFGFEQAGNDALKEKEKELLAKHGFKQGAGFPDAKSEEAFHKEYADVRLAVKAEQNDKGLQAAVDAGADPTSASYVPTKEGFVAGVTDSETGKSASTIIKGINTVNRDTKISSALTNGAAGLYSGTKNEVNLGGGFSPTTTRARSTVGMDTVQSPATIAETLLHESGHAFIAQNPGAISVPAADPASTQAYATGYLSVVGGGAAPSAAKVGEEEFLQGDNLKRFSLNAAPAGSLQSRSPFKLALTPSASPAANTRLPISETFRSLLTSTQ